MDHSKKIKTFPIILFKKGSWSPNIDHDKEWEKLKVRRHDYLHGCSKNLINDFDVTGDDIKELQGCFDLGFGFDPCNELDPKLSRVFPALELYNRQYYFNNRNDLSTCSSNESNSSVTSFDSLSFGIDTNEDPDITKMRLRRWAQGVAYSVHETCIQEKKEKTPNAVFHRF